MFLRILFLLSCWIGLIRSAQFTYTINTNGVTFGNEDGNRNWQSPSSKYANCADTSEKSPIPTCSIGNNCNPDFLTFSFTGTGTPSDFNFGVVSGFQVTVTMRNGQNNVGIDSVSISTSSAGGITSNAKTSNCFGGNPTAWAMSQQTNNVGGNGDTWGIINNLNGASWLGNNVQLKLRFNICNGGNISFVCPALTVFYTPASTTGSTTQEQTTSVTTSLVTTSIQTTLESTTSVTTQERTTSVTTALRTTAERTTSITTAERTTRERTTGERTTLQQTTDERTTAEQTTSVTTQGIVTTVQQFTTAQRTTGERTTSVTTALRTTARQTTGERTTEQQTTGIPASSTGSVVTQPGSSLKSNKKSSSSTIVIAIIIPVVCIILIILIVLFIVFRRRKNAQNQEPIQLETKPTARPAPAPASTPTPVPVPAPKPSRPADTTGVPISLLRAHVESLMNPVSASDQTLIYYAEFNQIEKKSEGFQHSFSAGSAPDNLPKNRYENVLAPDHSRVHLKGGSGSDYINANYLSGLVPGSEKQYIASQGPLPNTIPDFWRMIFEQNCSVVIMLTREIENNVLKCAKYWVENGEFVNLQNGIKLACRKDPTTSDEIITRELEVTDSKKTLKVSLLQYIAWPDHGLPQSTASFLDLANTADSLNYTKGPLVIHCSAGLGRTGTFCAIHSTMVKIKLDQKEGVDDPRVDLTGTILNFRKQRPGVVQTEDQYVFTWMAVLDGVEQIRSQKKKKDPSSHYVKITLLAVAHEN